METSRPPPTNTARAGTNGTIFLPYAVRIGERPVLRRPCHLGPDVLGPGAGGVVFPKVSKVLNQGDAPFYAVISAQRRRPRGARECCGEANQPLWMSHYHLRSANHRASSADDLPEIGGECTDRAARCKAGQGCRVGRPRYVNAYTRSSTVLGRVESEGKKISLVTMAARCS
jgi:hypothetical protein